MSEVQHSSSLAPAIDVAVALRVNAGGEGGGEGDLGESSSSSHPPHKVLDTLPLRPTPYLAASAPFPTLN